MIQRVWPRIVEHLAATLERNHEKAKSALGNELGEIEAVVEVTPFAPLLPYRYPLPTVPPLPPPYHLPLPPSLPNP